MRVEREGDTIKVEINDFTRRCLYKQKWNGKDKNAFLSFLKSYEKFFGINIPLLIQDAVDREEWF